MSEKKVQSKIEKVLSQIDTQGMVTSGFIKSDNKVIRAIIHETGFAGYAIYILLLSHRNTSTDECYPTIDVIAKESNCDGSYVKKVLKKLIEAGYLNTIPGKKGQASRYFFPCEDFYKIESETECRNKISSTKNPKQDTTEKAPAKSSTKNPEQQQVKNPELKTKSKSSEQVQVDDELPEDFPF